MCPDYVSCFSIQVPVALTPSENLVVAFFKARLHQGVCFSVPQDLFEAATAVHTASTAASSQTIMDALVRFNDPPTGRHVYLRVTNAKPESKYQAAQLHVSKAKSLICLQVLNTSPVTDAIGISDVATEERYIDVQCWADPELFMKVMRSLLIWVESPGNVSIEIAPSLSSRLAPQPLLDLTQVGDSLPAPAVSDVVGNVTPGLASAPSASGASCSKSHTIPPQPEKSKAEVEYEDCLPLSMMVAPKVSGSSVVAAMPVGVVAEPVVEVTSQSLSRDAKECLHELIKLRAFTENDSRVDQLQLCSSSSAIMELVEDGLIDLHESDTGNDLYSISLARVSLSGQSVLTNPQLLCQRARHAQFLLMSKIEVLQYLMQVGWAPSLRKINFYERGESMLCSPDPLKRPLSYLAALAMAPAIFLKPGGLRKICHIQHDSYFKLLIAADDLSSIAAITECHWGTSILVSSLSFVTIDYVHPQSNPAPPLHPWSHRLDFDA